MWRDGKSTSDALAGDCRRIESELRKAQQVLGEQNRKINSINREMEELTKLLADADLPQFPVVLNGKHEQIIVTRKTTARIYLRFAGCGDYGDWIGSKGTHIPAGWSLDIPAFLAWAKEQQNA